VLAAVLEDEPGAGDEVLDGGADQDLGGPGERRDPGADVHGDAADVGTDQLDLPGVRAGADLEAEGVQWANEILDMSPTAIRFLKSAFLVATDGLAGLQEFAGNATGLYYTTDEAHEGSTAFLEKRSPDYRKYPRRP